MRLDDVLIKPLVTEKVQALTDRHGRVAFSVATAANKFEVRAAVQARYKVAVTAVHTAVVPGKLRRRGRQVSRRPSWKKALVSLKPGERIDLHAGEPEA